MKKIYLLILGVISLFIITNKNVYAANYITLNQTNINLGVNHTANLKVIKVGDIESDNIVWSSSNQNIATVSNGIVTGKNIGTTTITAKIGSYYATCKVSVIESYIPITNITLKNTSGTVLINQTIQIPATISPSNASNKALIYTSRDSNIATVDNNGNITGKSLGTTYITVSSISQNIQATYKITVINTISLKGISINNSLTVKEQSSAKLSITYNPTNATNKQITWKSLDPSIATVDSNGNVTGIKAGTTTIQAISKDGGYVATCKVTVEAISKELKGISLNKTELTLDIGSEEILEVNFEPTYAENKKVTWTSSNKNIATVEDGKIKALKAGTTEITVTSEEGDFKATCKLTVVSLPIESISFVKPEQTVYLGDIITLETISTPEDSSLNDPIWTSSDETIATIENGILTPITTGIVTITISNPDQTIQATTTITIVEKPKEPVSIIVEGYDLNFDPNKKDYALTIKDETSLKFNINVDKEKVTINGNRDLNDGSIITITINDTPKATYIINIKKKGNYTIYFIGIISILLFINIIRMILKNKKKKTS